MWNAEVLAWKRSNAKWRMGRRRCAKLQSPELLEEQEQSQESWVKNQTSDLRKGPDHFFC
jgi:hypothetical protein